MTQRSNRRQEVLVGEDDYAASTGYLWQGRFASYPMDEVHLMVAVRYAEAEAADELGIVFPELLLLLSLGTQ